MFQRREWSTRRTGSKLSERFTAHALCSGRGASNGGAPTGHAQVQLPLRRVGRRQTTGPQSGRIPSCLRRKMVGHVIVVTDTGRLGFTTWGPCSENFAGPTFEVFFRSRLEGPKEIATNANN